MLLDRDTLLNEIMTSVEELVSDSSQHVRAALGTQLSGLAPILGKEEYVTGIFRSDLGTNNGAGLLRTYCPCSYRC